ncbi:acyl-CoA thioesterase [Marinobacter sp. X15-166B]|uniref:acyl-CoA thioesterase n=1 Tax=Marinobacter sp. X15-166B TaxID=1897620 RepID=UPI00085CB027|nr:thioesterase family protein [Marinobacter sp. X15-166B]OEY67728.1 thioesterase [Marinobacter sp. X15-166B]
MSINGRLVSTLNMPVRWGDMDAYGHTNNTVYFRFFEEARISWLNSVELSEADAHTGPVIINASATFLKELKHPATVCVHTYLGKAGNSSLETFYVITDADTGDTYCEGAAKIVWVDRTTMRSTRLPDVLRNLATE